ncbi:MAG: cation:proton antiporter [Solirubrobacterales bacterium]|nr:cation:proton antiporter [Solirubrobacterales bacterium]
MSVAAISLQAPEGSAWEFLVLFLVVILGPPLVQRARIPGLIGLLIGGFLIGPNGLGLLPEGSKTIPELGQLGLLYLMFVAGVELDLKLLDRHRRSAISFGLLTFAFPMALGTAAGMLLGWELPAALLLGSLLASHTLILYPLVRGAGLANDPVVASVVGATVLTDTIALVILAIIAGTQSGTGGTSDVLLELVLGFIALGLVCFLVLPFLARRAFRALGTERTVRYVIAIASFLLAAVVAETFGIEGIVGAFFAGLAMNRLVPNEGPLMSRIDFFGGAVFIPVFLVSVGLLLDPSVMFQLETLGLAGLFIVACLGGKFIAAQSTRLILGANGAQAGIAFALSTPQAAATLAATTVGFEIGLFGESVVNAVLVLILVSVLVATLVAERDKDRVTLPPQARKELGERVLVAVADFASAPLGLRLAREVAAREAGVVDVVLMVDTATSGHERQADLDRISGMCRRLGIDTDPSVRTSVHDARTTVLAANSLESSLVLAVGSGIDDGWAEDLAVSSPAPVAIVRGSVDRPLGEVQVVALDPRVTAAGTVAAELVAAVSRDGDGDGGRPQLDSHHALGPGEVGVAGVSGWDELSEASPGAETGLVLIPDQLLPVEVPEPSVPEPHGTAAAMG